MKLPNINKQLYLPIYLGILLIFTLIVKVTLATDEVKVMEAPEEEKVQKIEKVKVTIKVNSDTYEVEQKSNDSVMDAINELREDEIIQFVFEKTEYTYGTVIDDVNGIKLANGYVWRVFNGDKDITQMLNSTYLQDGQIYTIDQVKI